VRFRTVAKNGGASTPCFPKRANSRHKLRQCGQFLETLQQLMQEAIAGQKTSPLPGRTGAHSRQCQAPPPGAGPGAGPAAVPGGRNTGRIRARARGQSSSGQQGSLARAMAAIPRRACDKVRRPSATPAGQRYHRSRLNERVATRVQQPCQAHRPRVDHTGLTRQPQNQVFPLEH
jgi:hypothetical protein